MDKASEERDGKALPLQELSALAGLPPHAGITIDFEATEELGHPLVVLRENAFPDVLKKLSPREREVSRLVALGLNNKDIADRLHISLGTVKDHVHHPAALSRSRRSLRRRHDYAGPDSFAR